jgi:uncharacterized protein (TIGR02996 family)
MSEEQLLAAVLAAPQDDTPRLVYADWLTQRGDPRGEYIQLACRAFSLPKYTFEWDDVEMRAFALLRQHGESWRAPLADLMTSARFRRGFVWDATIDPARFGEVVPELLRRAPVEAVQLGDLDETRLRAIAASPSLAAVRNVGLHGAVGRAGLELLVRSQHLRRGATLGLWDPLDPDAGGALGGCDRIQSLVIPTGGQAAIPSIARMPSLVKLMLGVQGPLTRASIESLAGARLETLDLIGSGAGDLAAELGSPILRTLRLWHAGLSPVGARALIQRLSPTLENLDLSRNAIGDEGALAIAEAPQLAGLVDLNLERTGATDAAMHRLLRSPHLTKLEHVFGDTPLDVPGWRPGPRDGSLLRVRG